MTEPPPPFRPGLRDVAAAAPDFCLAGAFLITWFQPYTFGDRAVRHMMYIMLIEFLVVHSTGFLGVMATSPKPLAVRICVVTGLVLFYCIFAVAFSVAYGSLWPLYSFLGLTLAKLPSLFLSRPQTDPRKRIITGWPLMVMTFLFCAIFTTLLPLPRFGIDAAVVAQQAFEAEGIWIEQPYRVIAFGFLYFGLLGMYELTAYGRTPPEEPQEVPEASAPENTG